VLQEGFGQVPGDFYAEKVWIVIAGLFCKGTMPKFTPLPQSRTSKGGEGVKTIHYPLYLQDICVRE
jgi:hypothetical protein